MFAWIHRCAALAALALGIVADSPAIAADAPGHMAETDHGPMLVSATGMSLYYTPADDMAKGTTACTAAPGPTTMPDPTAGLGKYNLVGYKFVKSCVELWHPYAAPADAAPSGDWTVFARPDGIRQWAWQGKPLYLSARDRAPGDKYGVDPDFGGNGPTGRAASLYPQGRLPPFRFAGYAPFPAMPMGLKVVRAGEALVLADPDGKPYYTQRAGARLEKACAGCSGRFEPLEVASVAQLSGDWGAVDAGAGRRQIAFRGKPVFTAASDMTAEEIAGAGYEPVVFRKLAGPPPAISTRMTMAGVLYTDKAGRTLYTFGCITQGCDLPGGAAAALSALCSTGEECMRQWHPVLAAPGAKSSGEWSVIDVPQPMFTSADGPLYPPGSKTVKGWAWRGNPVFTYYMDKEPGDIWGNTVRWFNGAPYFHSIRVPVPGVKQGF